MIEWNPEDKKNKKNRSVYNKILEQIILRVTMGDGTLNNNMVNNTLLEIYNLLKKYQSQNAMW